MTVFLVRHGRPQIDRARLAHEWSLDPAYDDDVRALPDPHGAVLEFWDSAYRAGARRSAWDFARYDCPEGVTDPLR